jgi:hypothetical protein
MTTTINIEKSLCTLKNKFRLLIKDDISNLYIVSNGYYSNEASTGSDQDLLSKVSTISNLNEITELNKFYTPRILVKDTSLDSEYTQEYRLVYNTPLTSKTDSAWISSSGPLSRLLLDLSPDPRNPIENVLEGITQISSTDIGNYSIPVRTICVDSATVGETSKTYYVNGNYWVKGTHPINDNEYIKWNDNVATLGPIPTDFRYLPDAFSLGKIYVVFGSGNNQLEFYVVQNTATNGWLEITLNSYGQYNDANRRAYVKRWWNSIDPGYSCSEEALFEILNTNFVIDPNIVGASRYKGIMYNSSIPYKVGDIVAYENLLWKCIMAGTNNTPSDSSSYWSRYGDPIYNSLTYIPSKTVLLSSVNPSIPFKLITKVGSTTEYQVAVNSDMADFSSSCIATVLIQETINDLYNNYTVTVDLSEEATYKITEQIELLVATVNTKITHLIVNEGLIKNIYYRYKL